MAASCTSLALASEYALLERCSIQRKVCLVSEGFAGVPGALRSAPCRQQRPARFLAGACRAQNSSEQEVSGFKRRSAAVAATLLAIGVISTGEPAFGGILSGASDAQKKKYEQFDENFKTSPLLQQLLKKSEENKEVNKAAIQNKYCERGAEWGVGDCSLQGLSAEDKAAFFETLKAAKSKEAK